MPHREQQTSSKNGRVKEEKQERRVMNCEVVRLCKDCVQTPAWSPLTEEKRGVQREQGDTQGKTEQMLPTPTGLPKPSRKSTVI
jgi:hypothetical protein